MSETLYSFLRRSHADANSGIRHAYSDVSLHEGSVIAVYAPRDEFNISKRYYEYDVRALISRGIQIPTFSVYPRCRLQTAFGGVADHLTWSPRVEERDDQGKITSPGSQVIIECSNGINNQAVIIGAIAPEDAPEEDALFKNGPRLEWEYNGVNAVVNSDGELTVIRKGPTKNTLDDQGNVQFVNKQDTDGARLRLTKSGAVIVSTADQNNFFNIDQAGGSFAISSDKKFTVDTGKIETTTKSGVRLGGDEKLVKGNTYVAAEKAFLQGITSFLGQLSAFSGSLTGSTDPATVAAATLLSPAVNIFQAAVQNFSDQLDTNVLSAKNSTE